MKKNILLVMAISMIAINVYGQKPGSGDKLFTIGIFDNSAFFAYKVYKDSVRVNRFGISGNATWINGGKEDTYSPYAETLSKTTNNNSNFKKLL